MKLSAAVKRTQSAATNVANAISLLQVQAGDLKTAGTVLDRMSELASLAVDPTKSSTDIANYSVEYSGLTNELLSLSSDSFNGVSLFSGPVGTLTAFLSQDGSPSQTMGFSQHTLGNLTANIGWSASVTSGSLISNITDAIQQLSAMMATNGSESSRLQFALDSLNVNAVNLEAANSRIYDVDVAAETSKLARANILVQSGAAMLTQANASQSIALKLLQ
jgi:flagellin